MIRYSFGNEKEGIKRMEEMELTGVAERDSVKERKAKPAEGSGAKADTMVVG